MKTNEMTLAQAAANIEENDQTIKIGQFESFADFLSYFQQHYRPMLEEWRESKHLPDERLFNFFVDDMLSAFSDEEPEEEPEELPEELANADADELRRWERDQVKCFVPWLLGNETPTEWYAYAQGCPFGWTDYAWNGKTKATRDLMAAIGNGTHPESALYNRYAKLVARLTWQREAEELRRRWDEAFSMAKDDPEKYRVIVETNEDDPTAKGNEFGRYFMVDGSESESCIDHAVQWAVIRSDTVKTAYEVHRPNWHQLNGYDDEWTQIFCRCENPNNVTRWAEKMIARGRVMDIYADSY